MTMKFKATLKKGDGTEEHRIIDAASRFAVYEQAEKEGYAVTALEEGSGFALPSWTKVSIGSGVSVDQKITFAKSLAAMLGAGLTLARALAVTERQASSKRMREIATELGENVKKGSTFHEALAAHPNVFSKLFVAMAKAGEESGTLANSLAIVARQMERSHALARKIKSAMIYPSIILVAIIIITVLMLLYVVPTLSATFAELGVELPATTRAIVAASNFMLNNSALTLAGVVTVVVGGYSLIRSAAGGRALLALMLRVPVIGLLIRETMSARAARSLASLLSSHVEMLLALSITEEVVGTRTFARVVAEANERVKKGEELSAAFSEHPKLYPVLFSDMIAVGEETGKVAEMLSQVAEYYEDDVENRTKDLSTVIEPVLMLLIGGVVGVFAVSMISPIYSITENI